MDAAREKSTLKKTLSKENLRSLWSRAKAPVCNGKGYTLLEIMVVVAIIGILSAIAVLLMQDYRNKMLRSADQATGQAEQSNPPKDFPACVQEVSGKYGALAVVMGSLGDVVIVARSKTDPKVKYFGLYSGHIHTVIGHGAAFPKPDIFYFETPMGTTYVGGNGTVGGSATSTEAEMMRGYKGCLEGARSAGNPFNNGASLQGRAPQ